MRLVKAAYWLTTVGVCAIMTFSASMYIAKTETIRSAFESLGYPSYIVIPLAILKILGILMILWRGIPWLTEWAYAGFFFDAVLAFIAHIKAEDGAFLMALLATIFTVVSYHLGRKVRPMYA